MSPADPEAEITKLKDGRTALAYKVEQAVDMETGAIVAVSAGVPPASLCVDGSQGHLLVTEMPLLMHTRSVRRARGFVLVSYT